MTSVTWLLEELKKVHHPTEAMIIYANKLHKQEIVNAFSAGAEDGFDGLGDSDVELYYETLANGKDWSKVTLKMRDLFKQNTTNEDWENSSGFYQKTKKD